MSAADARVRIAAQLRKEALQPVPTEAIAFAEKLATHYGSGVAAVLLYGSCLRERHSEGLLDFYVIVDEYPAASMSALGMAAARLLPPAVYHHTMPLGERVLRAKVAVISSRQFRRRMEPHARDTSLWARFCQPTALVYRRDAAVHDELAATLAEAVVTATLWAARVGPESGSPADFWRALFAATYAAELRVEAFDRGAQIVAAAPERYATMLIEGWRASDLPVANETLANPLPNAVRHKARRGWRARRWANRSLNVLRLVKAAFTFEGGADYIAWKVERHSRRQLALSSFQRRHPILAAPSILWLLIRGRIVR